MRSIKCNSNKNKMGKSMTYEEIGEVMDLTPQQVHKSEKEAFNKLVKGLMINANMSIFDSIIAISKYLGIEVEHCYKKLDKENKQTLSAYTFEKYGRRIKGIKPLFKLYDRV